MEIQRLYPVFKDYLWGGNKLKEEYGKECDSDICAESWELSLHRDGKTRLADGRSLEEALTEREIGANVSEFASFPTMIKFIDAKSKLSFQVHPDDSYALEHENSFGKTEMWYIVQAEEGAGIYLGFKRDVTPEEFKTAISNNTLPELMNFCPVKEGESYFIPSGTVHAIGEGCLICEIQQSSNLTYRVYDYDRTDKNGCKRELHIDKALAVTNLKKHQIRHLEGNTSGISRYFNVQRLDIRASRHLSASGKSFHCVTCLKGVGKINETEVRQGDSFFVPADFGEYTLEGNMTVLLTDVRKYYIAIALENGVLEGKLSDDEGNIIVREALSFGEKGVEEGIVTLLTSLSDRAVFPIEAITEIAVECHCNLKHLASELSLPEELFKCPEEKKLLLFKKNIDKSSQIQ